MDNMILGRYIPGDSIIHRLDPRSKLLAMFLLIVISFWANNPITNLLLFVVTGIFISLSGVPLSFFYKRITFNVLSNSFYNYFPAILHIGWSGIMGDRFY